MSILGTGAAAAVAQTGLNAQQQARRADKSQSDVQRAVVDTVVTLTQRLEAPADADDTPGDLPDRGAPGYENLYGSDGRAHGPGFDAATPGGDGPAADGSPPRRLDITG